MTLDGTGCGAGSDPRWPLVTGLGVKIEHIHWSQETLFAPGFGDLVAEVPAEEVDKLSAGTLYSDR